MNIEALKQQLSEGKITKEQFAAELKKLLDAGTITQDEHDEATKTEGPKALTAEEIQAMIKAESQKEADRVRTEYAKKLKDAQDEADRLKTEKMTDADKAKFEREKFEKDLEDREKSLNLRVVELHTIDKLTEAKLPLTFKSFLVSTTTEDADKNVAAFATAWQSELKAAVEAKFKDSGSTPPGKGGGGAGTSKNPWAKETFNLTKQAEILKSDPELAKQFMAQAK